MTIKDIVFIALFAALTAALSIVPPVNVPVINVPITAQTFGVMLAGGVLGARRGALSMILFLALVAVGLPFLSGGRGGAGVFMGASGGFLIGWVIAAFVIGYMVERSWEKLNFVTAMTSSVVGGILILYAIGIPWIAVVAGISIDKAALSAIAYVPGDLVKAGLASIIMIQVKRAYPLISVKA
ncbi:biotin transporter BioY [Sneathiella sp. P13V-1]|uniref:biotin transporter BioY n=1 Tax=Sneathiella sp. P13V-1 TaxID=2697366 RepID=UPI00187BAB38|nr:biotin transporter BioY [Sneathiella sp. P13V-1]MBE7638426.1 biotin transporter BioY [Sneathiella sp. P13V-1]